MKRFANFRLDVANECLWKKNTRIAIPPKPFAVLRYLVEHPGRLVTHEELLDALWPETYVQPQVLRTYVLDLRKVLGDDAAQPRFIQTQPKRGYCFVAPLEECDEPAASATPVSPVARIPDTALPGRQQELAALDLHFNELTHGQRRIVFITGEAGIGKTAIVEAFCRRVSAEPGTCMARGQCVDGVGAKEEYYPVIEALRHLCASADGERACQALSTLAPAWLASVGRSGDAAQTEAHERMPGDLCAALEELAAAKPLVLVLEDLHWADVSTLHLLSALARRRGPARLMVLATGRLQESPPDNPLLTLKQDLQLRKLCIELALEPLTRPFIHELLCRELHQDQLPQGLAAFVYEHSEGNPLFAIAILEHLVDQHFLVCEETDGSRNWKQRAQFQEMEAGVPYGLSQMIALELSRLSPQEQRLLEAISLVSIAFPAWAVAAALDEDVAETEEACDRLARRVHFLKRGGEDQLPDGTCTAFYVFAHSLYREVIYQQQSATRRARRHTRVAERLLALFHSSGANVVREIALHYEAAGNWKQSLSALRTAARHAGARQAHAEAVNLLEHALRLADDPNSLNEAARPEIANELASARNAMESLSLPFFKDQPMAAKA